MLFLSILAHLGTAYTGSLNACYPQPMRILATAAALLIACGGGGDAAPGAPDAASCPGPAADTCRNLCSLISADSDSCEGYCEATLTELEDMGSCSDDSIISASCVDICEYADGPDYTRTGSVGNCTDICDHRVSGFCEDSGC